MATLEGSKAARKGGVGRLQARQGSSVFSQPRLRDPCAPGLARWATSGLFQLKPATPASTALAVLPMPAMSPCTHVLRYPRHLGCFCLAGRSQGLGGSLTHANSLDQRWVPIQLTLVCLSPEVPAVPPSRRLSTTTTTTTNPFSFPVGVLPGRRSPSVSPAVVGTSAAVQSVVVPEGDDRRSH